ncbi:class I SAM-dependent methyltransferase [Pseudonocardia xishanensis]|uniref:Uncharacterized protein n=1 Tax=Pseudonocardia xishanensis TaxID=630995 RepID=A0ABP8RVE1_9PSEU
MTALVDGRGPGGLGTGNEVVGARWGGTREEPHTQPRRARAESLTEPSRAMLGEVLESVLRARAVGTVTVVGADPHAGLYADLGAGSVHVVAKSPTPAVRAAVTADPALHLVTDGDPPPAELYVLAGDTGYHGTRRELERVMAEEPDAVVLVWNVLWPAGRRDVLPGVGAHGPSVGRDGLGPAGLGAGAVDAADEAGGEENGVLTAVEDVLAEADESWTMGVVPALSGLAVLARDEAWFAEELWETLLPWTTSELLAGLERNRIALVSRVLELEYAATAAARESADHQIRLTRCLQQLDAAWDEIADLRAEHADNADNADKAAVSAASRPSLRARLRLRRTPAATH